MKKTALLTIGAGALAIGLSACAPMPSTHTYGTMTPGVAPTATYVPTQAPAPVQPVSRFTQGQQQAIDKAQSYLDYSAFSQSGLVDQLKYEGFSEADATFAVSQIDVDWTEQAVKKGKSYLSYSSFSQSGLVDQLEYEGFTPAQAQAGAAGAYGS